MIFPSELKLGFKTKSLSFVSLSENSNVATFNCDCGNTISVSVGEVCSSKHADCGCGIFLDKNAARKTIQIKKYISVITPFGVYNSIHDAAFDACLIIDEVVRRCESNNELQWRFIHELEKQRNKRDTVISTPFGEFKSMASAGKAIGKSKVTIRNWVLDEMKPEWKAI